MDDKKNVWIKKEEANDISGIPDSMFPQDPLSVEKREPGLNLDVGDSEHKYLEDSLLTSRSTESIKEDAPLNLEAEETEDFTHTHLQQFELDQLEGVTKHEQGTETSVQQQQSLLSMLLRQPSPPHHLLTLPDKDTHLLYSAGQKHAGMLLQEAVQHSAEPGLVALQHLGTLPETPPVNTSPPPYTVAAPAATAGSFTENVGWFPQSAERRLTPEPLDLQANCTADNVTEPQCMPVLPAATSVIVGNCHKQLTEDVLHHSGDQNGEEQLSVQSSGADSISSTAQHHKQQYNRHELDPPLSPQLQCATSSASSTKDILDDDVLVSLSAPELRKKLCGYPREEVLRLRRKRRALKNRSYSQNCRRRWLKQRQDLRVTHRTLIAELQRLKVELASVTQERNQYKKYLEQQLCHTAPASAPCADTGSTASPATTNLHV